MLVNFETEPINLNELKKAEESVLLVEGDIIVPDVNPDISRVLLTDAAPAVTKKEWHGDKIEILGNVFVNILYSPENQEEGQPKIKSINTRLDFSDSFAFSAENPSLSAKAEILSINCTLINSRKVNVKVTVKLLTKAYVPYTLLLNSEPDTELHIETKKKSYSIHTTPVDVQKEFVFEEILEVPSAKCDIEEILKTNVSIIKGECRTGDEKITLRGTVGITTLYAGFDDGFSSECMEHELPFSQILDVPGLHEDCMCNVTYDIKNVSVQCRNDENGDPREIAVSVTVNANITASKVYDMEILDDLYCPGKMCDVRKETKTLKRSVLEGQSRASLKNTFTLPENAPGVARVYSVSSHPVIREYTTENGKLILKGDVTAFILYGDSDETLNSEVCQFIFEHTVDMDENSTNFMCEYDLSVIGTNFNIISESEIEIRTNVEFFVRLTEDFNLDLITECNVSDFSEDISALPQLIIYFVQKGDTLWDIAKHYNTTVKRIKEANHIENITSSGEKLLIPAR